MRQGVIGCCVFLLSVCSVGAQHCDAQRSKVLKFSISSRRNATGHWIAQVGTLVLLMCCVRISTSLICNSSPSMPLKLSITSRSNLTGHWIAQVQLLHGTEPKGAGPWAVDIQHMTTNCEGFDAVQVIATLTAPPSTPKPPPHLGYDLVPGLGYYKLHTDIKTWDEALHVCEQEGAHLLVINSEEEAKALAPFWDANPKILDGAANNWAHAGFHDKYKEGQYLTVFNETLVGAGYVKWLPGDPTGIGQNCGVVIRRENLLGDAPCDYKLGFFCEKEL